MDIARESGFDDILWINSENEVTEASTANIFFIGREGDDVFVHTPPETSGLLKGITRKTIIELLRANQVEVSEEILLRDELARFDEAFVCSTVRGLVPIQAIDQHRLYTLREMAVFRYIQKLFNQHVADTVGFAVDWNTGVRCR